MPLDTQLVLFLNSLTSISPALDSIIIFFASYLAYVLIIAFAIFILFSGYEWRKRFEALGVVLVSVFIARGVITELIRFFYHRPRPFIDLPIQPLFTDPAWSFPSGHATFFFALATSVYLYNKKWGIGFYIATILMTISRVVAGIHYPSDIIAGALIGIAVVYTTFYFVRKLG